MKEETKCIFRNCIGDCDLSSGFRSRGTACNGLTDKARCPFWQVKGGRR